SRRGVARSYHQSLVVPNDAWRNGNTDAATAAAETPAGAIIAIVGGQETEVAQAPAAKQAKFPRVSIKPADGAPGDGRDSLRLAIIQVLYEKGVPRDDTNPEIVLNCTVTSTPVAGEQQKVEIVWHAISS